MNKFVKIKGFEEPWFMLISDVSELPDGIEDKTQKRIAQKISKDIFNKGKPNISFDLLYFINITKPDYAKQLEKYKRSCNGFLKNKNYYI